MPLCTTASSRLVACLTRWPAIHTNTSPTAQCARLSLVRMRSVKTSSLRLLYTTTKKPTTTTTATKTTTKPLIKTPLTLPNREQILRRQAGQAAERSQTAFEIAERLLIYHAGTGRTTFLAILKVTTIFVAAFFFILIVPACIRDEETITQTIKVAICGILPFAIVGFTTAPFVTHMHIHLPAPARTSRAALERFVRAGVPPRTPITVTTMSLIGKPHYSALTADALVPVLGPARTLRRRAASVNFVRDDASRVAENRDRKWYQSRAVSEFSVPDPKAQTQAQALAAKLRLQKQQLEAGARGGKKAPVESWIWEAVKKRALQRYGVGGGKEK